MKTIIYKINKNSECMHWDTFQVSRILERICIRIAFPEVFRYMGFVILKSPSNQVRFQKLLGYGEQELCIGTTTLDTSIGGVPGEIEAGEWSICFGVFTEYVSRNLGDNEVEITLDIKEGGKPSEPIDGVSWTDAKTGLLVNSQKYDWNQVYASDTKWYKGDLHTHTTMSDGKDTVSRAMDKAKEQEMDFYIPTEHNLVHTGWRETSLCIIPGTEITTEQGHFNLFGITKLPDTVFDIIKDHDVDSMRKNMSSIIDVANEQGWITSINHPFLTIWSWLYNDIELSKIQTIEIVNDPTYTYAKPSNNKAILLMDALWNDGHKIFGVGGSDAHNLYEERYEGATQPSVIGDPSTHVHCEELTPNCLLDNIRKGHIYVTRYCDLELEISANQIAYLPGEEISVLDDTVIHYAVKVNCCEESPKVYLVQDGKYLELIVEQCGENEFYAKTEVVFRQGCWNWARIEVRNQENEFLAYTNPIYSGYKKQQLMTFGEIKKVIEG